jgi:hypothetical protein
MLKQEIIMLKKIKVFIKLLLVFMFFLPLVFSAPSYYGGADGYLAVPSLTVPSDKRVAIAFRYMGVAENKITPLINFVPYKKDDFGVEIGSSLDIILADNIAVSPLLFSVKMQFAKPTALGALIEIPLDSAAVFAISPYFAFESSFSIAKMGSGKATIAIGYTFSGELTSDINFHAGFYQSLGIEKVALIVDFMNYTYHHSPVGMANQNESRAIINVGIRILPHERFTIDFAGVDLMDSSRGLSAGLSIYF